MALEAKNKYPKDEEKRITKFYELLENYCDIASIQLCERYQFQCTAIAKQFPMLMSGMWLDSDNLNSNDEVREVLKHGTLGIGFLGLAECLIALTGKHHAESEESQQLGLEIIERINNKVAEYKDKYNLNYSVLATPAEGLSGRFVKNDKKEFGIIEGVTDKDYYTNSNHVPVYYKCSIKHKAEIEAPYHELTKGGHIFYVEFDGDATKNVLAVEQYVKYIDKYHIGYGSVNHTRSRCMDCGFENSEKDLAKCPVCEGINIDTIQRITGYLVGTTSKWNKAKLAELKDRTTVTSIFEE